MIHNAVHPSSGSRRCLWAVVLVVVIAVTEMFIWRGVAGLKQESRIQLDTMIFQTGMLGPLMYDFIKVLDGDKVGDQTSALSAEQRMRLLASRRRIDPHLTALRQTTDLLSNVAGTDEIRRKVSDAIDKTSATLDRAEAELAEPEGATRIASLMESLQDNLAVFSGSLIHTIEQDRKFQQERSNLFATVIGLLFSVLLVVGVILIRLICVLRIKTDELKQLAMTDTLTGLLNRRECMRQATRMSLLAGHKNVPVTMAIIDLDHFKAINDTHGHPGGDAVLQSVAVTIVASGRENDVFARLGGEEFAIFMYDTSRSTGAVVCERVRRDLEASVVSFNGHVIPVTASIGMATAWGADTDIEMLYARADKALYKAKAMGRNRMVADDGHDLREAGLSPVSHASSDGDLQPCRI